MSELYPWQKQLVKMLVENNGAKLPQIFGGRMCGRSIVNKLVVNMPQYMNYSGDKRKRRRQHRVAAKNLSRNGGGSTFGSVAKWHLDQARLLGR